VSESQRTVPREAAAPSSRGPSSSGCNRGRSGVSAPGKGVAAPGVPRHHPPEAREPDVDSGFGAAGWAFRLATIFADWPVTFRAVIFNLLAHGGGIQADEARRLGVIAAALDTMSCLGGPAKLAVPASRLGRLALAEQRDGERRPVNRPPALYSLGVDGEALCLMVLPIRAGES
jgi:hypothetical protein